MADRANLRRGCDTGFRYGWVLGRLQKQDAVAGRQAVDAASAAWQAGFDHGMRHVLAARKDAVGALEQGWRTGFNAGYWEAACSQDDDVGDADGEALWHADGETRAAACDTAMRARTAWDEEQWQEGRLHMQQEVLHALEEEAEV